MKDYQFYLLILHFQSNNEFFTFHNVIGQIYGEHSTRI